MVGFCTPASSLFKGPIVVIKLLTASVKVDAKQMLMPLEGSHTFHER